MLVLLAQIQRTEKLQARAAEHKRPDGTLSAIDPDHVASLVEVLKAGNTFETNPIVYVDGDGYQLADGWHRLAAYEAVGRTEVEVEIREGGPSAAFRHALGANAHHGLPRSQASKRRAVDLALADAELGVLPDREIARITSTSHTFVAGRRALAAANSDLETAAPRSRAESLARARAQASGCLSYLLDLGIETITHQALGSVRCEDLLPQLATMEWAGVKEIIRAAAQAEAEKRQAALLRSAQPTEPTAPLPGQQLLLGGEVPATSPVGVTYPRPAGADLSTPGPRSESSEPESSAENRMARDDDAGAVTGPIDRERLRTALCRLQTGGITRLPAPSRQSIMGALLILDEAPEEALQRLHVAVQAQLAEERARRELLAHRLGALREQGEYTLTTARGTMLCRPDLAHSWPLAGLDDLDRQIVALEGIASEAKAEPAPAPAEAGAAEEDEMVGEALDAWRDGVLVALGLSEGAGLDLVTREIARLRGDRDRYAADLSCLLQDNPPPTYDCTACSAPTDRMEVGELTTYPLCWACAVRARDEVIDSMRAAGSPSAEVPDGWPEGWAADPNVGGNTHAAWHGPRRADGHRGPSAVIYTATGGGFEMAMELVDEERAEDAAELLRRMAWGLAGRPLSEAAPAPADSLLGTPAGIARDLWPAATPTAKPDPRRWVAGPNGWLVGEHFQNLLDLGETLLLPADTPPLYAPGVSRVANRPDGRILWQVPTSHVRLADPSDEPAPTHPWKRFQPWRRSADELAGELTAIDSEEFRGLIGIFNVLGGKRIVERLAAEIIRAGR